MDMVLHKNRVPYNNNNIKNNNVKNKEGNRYSYHEG